jgi:hypothetical protein
MPDRACRMPCYQSNTHLFAATVDDSAATIYFVSLASQSPVRITFDPPTGGTITSVQSSPTGPSTGVDWIEFATAHINTPYTVTIIYSTGSDERVAPGERAAPLETPTKKPTFKPVATCP